ncbi:glucosamine inositolphosphorylceramide transferase family protein [Mycobacterium sp. 050134]|uniref:glucosamine inositolphosphorylceramide transferase family protein n=1 Tax=Mycobacterium sp. 050134 TaxID=3096111 RepID=UPI002EDADD7A
MTKLSVGYLVDEGYQPNLVFDLIEKSQSAAHYSIDHLIVQTFPERRGGPVGKALRLFRERRFLKTLAALCFRAILAMEVRVFVRDPRLKSAFETRHLDDLQVPKLLVRPIKSPSGAVYRYGADDLESIRGLNVDVLVRGGSGILRGGILDLCEFGIISFHHGNNDVNRGGPPAFWEVFNHEPSTGFVIQRLLDELDGGDVLARGSIGTVSPYARNLARIHNKSNVFLHKFLEDLGRTKALPAVLPKSPYSHRLYRMPSLRDLARYQIDTLNTVMRRLSDRLTGRQHRWGVAYQFAESWRSSVLWRSKFIANPAHRFLADPFVFRHEKLDACFVEDYDFRTKKGKISVIRVDPKGYELLGTALEEPFHLSYPFVFTVDGELYMCPETAEIKEIRLYKCVDFPLRWSFHKTLVSDVSAADTTIFFSRGRWWLLTNIDSADMGDHNSELHVFCADAFDSEAWIPHANNPVVFDSGRARNGGFFRDGDTLLRVFQTQGYDLYGESMGIAEITGLGPDTYSEEVVTRIAPRFAPKIVGTHSFSYHDGLLAIDVQKVERVGTSR